MFGPVTTAMRPPSASSPERSQSLAMKGSPAALSAASTTGWRPPSILKASEESTTGRVQSRLTASSASAAATSIVASAAPKPRKVSPRGEAGLPQLFERVEFERERPVGRRGDLRLELDQRGGRKAQRSGHRLAMDEGRVERRLQQRLALRLRHLDVIAEEIVVLDLELPDPGLLGVSRLHFGDDPPALVAQRARFVERSQRAGAHEAALALHEAAIRPRASPQVALERAAVDARARARSRKSSGGRPPRFAECGPARRLPRGRRERQRDRADRRGRG